MGFFLYLMTTSYILIALSIRPSVEVLKFEVLSVRLSRSWNPNRDLSIRLSVVHVRFRATTAVVDVASNPPLLQFATATVNTRVFFFFPPFFSGLPRVNTKVFFFPPFSGELPRVNTWGFFYSRPFLAGSLCMAEPASVYFKWCCPRLIPRVFFFHPFLAGYLGLIPGFYYYYFFRH
jgi:hypothetical protein